ncbi:MAG: hypothetical protein ACXWNQ_03535 [Anaerolineales bacterium]
MLHSPHADPFRATTHELICALIGRLDTTDCLFSLLALMIEMSDHTSIKRQWLMAGSLRDAAEMMEERPAVRDLIALLGASERHVHAD